MQQILTCFSGPLLDWSTGFSYFTSNY